MDAGDTRLVDELVEEHDVIVAPNSSPKTISVCPLPLCHQS